jgi:hypothetical protein
VHFSKLRCYQDSDVLGRCSVSYIIRTGTFLPERIKQSLVIGDKEKEFIKMPPPILSPDTDGLFQELLKLCCTSFLSLEENRTWV